MCAGAFDDHSYAHFAVTVLDEREAHRALDLIDACEDHRWEDARRFQEFDQQNDALVAYAMRCNTGRMSLLLERSPYDAYELDRLFSCNVLDVTSGERLERTVAPNDWRRLNWT